MKNISILTSGHPPFDERIFHKMAFTFIKSGYKVNIICSTLKVDNITDGITVSGFEGNSLSKREKKRKFLDYIRSSQPDILICCEPFTILPAYEYKKTAGKPAAVISDITEWYPENVSLKLRGVNKLFSYLKLFLFNIYSTNLADRLIIGEETKLRRYKLIAPFKKKEIIGYYPRLEFFRYSPPPFNGQTITLCYAGLITFERGIIPLLHTALKAAQDNPNVKIKLKIVGKFQYADEEKAFREKLKEVNSVIVEFISWGKYQEISDKISDADICFDLRRYTFVYRNSLPIKIFEYMACGKPVIFSDINPIRKEMDVEKFGFLVDPGNIDEIVRIISLYINNNQLLKSHSLEARKQIELYFNWEKLESRLIRFIES